MHLTGTELLLLAAASFGAVAAWRLIAFGFEIAMAHDETAKRNDKDLRRPRIRVAFLQFVTIIVSAYALMLLALNRYLPSL